MRHASSCEEKGCMISGIIGVIMFLAEMICMGVPGLIMLLLIVAVVIVIVAISEHNNAKRRAEDERIQEEERRRKEEEHKRIESDRLAKVADLTRRPLKELSADELSFLALEFGNDEEGRERYYINAIQAGSRCAKELLALQAEKCNPKSTPQETIAHCDEINNIVPNGMCYYRKGLALKDLRKTDEAIAALETAVSVDDAARSEATKLTFAARDSIAKILPSLKNISRKKHIEKDGQYSLVKTGIEYEDFVCGVIRRMGYACKKTPATDQGVDLVVSLKNGKKLAVQCKFLSVPVSNSAVQEVVAGKALYNCSHACVVGKSGYTKAAIALAKANNVWLIRHDGIQDCISLFEMIS